MCTQGKAGGMALRAAFRSAAVVGVVAMLAAEMPANATSTTSTVLKSDDESVFQLAIGTRRRAQVAAFAQTHAPLSFDQCVQWATNTLNCSGFTWANLSTAECLDCHHRCWLFNWRHDRMSRTCCGQQNCTCGNNWVSGYRVRMPPSPPATNPVPAMWVDRAAAANLIFATEPVNQPAPNFGNGYTATQWQSAAIYVAGLFSSSASGETRAAIPAPYLVDLAPPWHRTSLAVDMELACIRAIYTYGGNSTMDSATPQIEMRTYAHRAHMHLLITDFTVQTQGQGSDLKDLQVNLQFVDEFEPVLENEATGRPDVDLHRTPDARVDAATSMTPRTEIPMGMDCYNGSTRTVKQVHKGQIAPVVVSLCRTLPPAAGVVLSAGESFTFTTALYTSLDSQFRSGDSSYPLQAAQSEWTNASSLGGAALFLSHRKAQEKLWTGRIEVADNHALVS